MIKKLGQESVTQSVTRFEFICELESSGHIGHTRDFSSPRES